MRKVLLLSAAASLLFVGSIFMGVAAATTGAPVLYDARSPQPRPQATAGAEFGVDRNGGDYRHFELPADPSGKSCGTACEADESCRAWTYVRPGYVGSSAVCYLKNRITRPVRKPCCISGVVR